MRAVRRGHGSFRCKICFCAFFLCVGRVGPDRCAAHQGTRARARAAGILTIVDGAHTKCVKVELTQSGADIAGRVLYAKYLSGNVLGFDFDTGGNNQFIATSFASAGYGAYTVTFTVSSFPRMV